MWCLIFHESPLLFYLLVVDIDVIYLIDLIEILGILYNYILIQHFDLNNLNTKESYFCIR